MLHTDKIWSGFSKKRVYPYPITEYGAWKLRINFVFGFYKRRNSFFCQKTSWCIIYVNTKNIYIGFYCSYIVFEILNRVFLFTPDTTNTSIPDKICNEQYKTVVPRDLSLSVLLFPWQGRNGKTKTLQWHRYRQPRSRGEGGRLNFLIRVT